MDIKITDEHLAKRDEWADMWIARGLCTEEAAWEDFAKGVEACYGHAKEKWHGKIIRCGHPLTLSNAAAIAHTVMDLSYRKKAKQKRDGKFCERMVEIFTEKKFRRVEIEKALEAIQGTFDAGEFGYELVYDKNALKRIEKVKMAEKVSIGWNNALGGQFWLAWQAYESFFREVVGVDLPTNQRAADYALAQQSACWWWPHTHFVMVSDRPTQIHREQIAPRGWGSHRLHNDKGPAIAWERGDDKWLCYFVNGVDMKAEHVENPSTITLKIIRDESHAERRRILTELYGVGRYLTDTGAKLLHMDGGLQVIGGAPRALMQDDTGQKWLVGTDGSTKRVYHMPVPEEVATCKQAHESICGLSESMIVAES